MNAAAPVTTRRRLRGILRRRHRSEVFKDEQVLRRDSPVPGRLQLVEPLGEVKSEGIGRKCDAPARQDCRPKLTEAEAVMKRQDGKQTIRRHKLQRTSHPLGHRDLVAMAPRHVLRVCCRAGRLQDVQDAGAVGRDRGAIGAWRRCREMEAESTFVDARFDDRDASFVGCAARRCRDSVGHKDGISLNESQLRLDLG